MWPTGVLVVKNFPRINLCFSCRPQTWQATIPLKIVPNVDLAALGGPFSPGTHIGRLKSPALWNHHPNIRKNQKQPPLHWRRQRITASCEGVKIPTVDCDQDLQYTSGRHVLLQNLSLKRWVSPHTKKNKNLPIRPVGFCFDKKNLRQKTNRKYEQPTFSFKHRLGPKKKTHTPTKASKSFQYWRNKKEKNRVLGESIRGWWKNPKKRDGDGQPRGCCQSPWKKWHVYLFFYYIAMIIIGICKLDPPRIWNGDTFFEILFATSRIVSRRPSTI